MYTQQKEELQPHFEKLKRVNRQIEEIRCEFGIQNVKPVQPMLSTSFMHIRGANMRKEYDEKVREIRAYRSKQRQKYDR